MKSKAVKAMLEKEYHKKEETHCYDFDITKHDKQTEYEEFSVVVSNEGEVLDQFNLKITKCNFKSPCL